MNSIAFRLIILHGMNNIASILIWQNIFFNTLIYRLNFDGTIRILCRFYKMNMKDLVYISVTNDVGYANVES